MERNNPQICNGATNKCIQEFKDKKMSTGHFFVLYFCSHLNK